MAFTEKPPILRGTEQEQINALRDYLFRMAQSLGEAAASETSVNVTQTVRPDGSRVYNNAPTAQLIDEIRRNVADLRAQIIRAANQAVEYTDRQIRALDSVYLSQTAFSAYSTQTDAAIQDNADAISANTAAIGNNADAILQNASDIADNAAAIDAIEQRLGTEPLMKAPVGSVYATDTNANPGALLGGTWALISQSAIPDIFFWQRTA